MHIMVDLETMSTAHDAAIVSIGAVAFDPRATPGPFESYKGFYENVSLESSTGIGLRIDKATENWWAGQPRAIREALETPEPIPVEEALARFKKWCLSNNIDVIWSHGATFDIVILESAYKLIGERAPWGFRDHRDTRTLFAVANANFYAGSHLPGWNEKNHVASKDAWRQAVVAQSAYEKLGIKVQSKLL